MIEELATVTWSGPGVARVEAARISACAQCSRRSGCGQGALSQWSRGRNVEIEVLNPDNLPLTPGQQVLIGLEEGSLLRASLLLYLLPLLMLVAGALFASVLGAGEALQMLVAALLLLAGFALVRLLTRNTAELSRYQPVLLKTL
ncbi:MAG: SoxR reducing system RseC family protein [Pseudomonadota bacterium]|jgi:sigma-E factor negative regulatory protein RseC|nr:SoxR reducing system RseC family protein [Pseudomonadota bacterium]